MLHPREIQVLNAIAKYKEPTISQDIAYNEKISQSTVQAVLRKMLEEGYVEKIGVTHNNNVLARQFILTDKVKGDVLKQMVDVYLSVKDIVSVDEVCATLQEIKNQYLYFGEQNGIIFIKGKTQV